MSFGVTDVGFVRKSIETILEEIEAEQKSAIHPNLDVSAESPIGQLNGIFASHLSEVWETIEAAYYAFDPERATGDALVAISALTGTQPRGATKSTVLATVNLDAGFTLNAGAIASVAGDAAMRYVTKTAVTNNAGVAADVSVEMEAEEAGSHIRANAGTLTEIETQTAGWNSITNASDSEPGTDADTNAELRVRRRSELSADTGSPLDSLRSDLLRVDGVFACSIFENTKNRTVDGIGPHGIECVVLGGDDSAVADRIWKSKAAGILTTGAITVVVQDNQGEDHDVRFSRPTEVPVYITIEFDYDPDLYPADGDVQIENALVEQQPEIANTLVVSRLYAPIFSVAGVVDVTAIKVDTSSNPTSSDNIEVTLREIAALDTSRIVLVKNAV